MNTSQHENYDEFPKNGPRSTGHTDNGVRATNCQNPIDIDTGATLNDTGVVGGMFAQSLGFDKNEEMCTISSCSCRLRDNMDGKENKQQDGNKNEEEYYRLSKTAATIISNLQNEVDTLRLELDDLRSSSRQQRKERHLPQTPRNPTDVSKIDTDTFYGKRKAGPTARSYGGEKVGHWSEDEHRLFLLGLKLHGKRWIKVATVVKTRTDLQIRSHAQKYFQKLAKMIGIKVHELSDEVVESMVDKDLESDPKPRKKPRNGEVDILDTRRAHGNLNDVRHTVYGIEEGSYPLFPHYPSSDEKFHPLVSSSGNFLQTIWDDPPSISQRERRRTNEKNTDAVDLHLLCDLLE